MPSDPKVLGVPGITREHYDMEGLIRMMATGCNLLVAPAQLATKARQQILGRVERGVSIRVLQNHGTVPVKYWVSDNVPDYANDPCHGVIAGGSSNYDGLGSLVDLGKFSAAVWIDNAQSPGTDGLLVGIFLAYNREINASPDDLMVPVQ